MPVQLQALGRDLDAVQHAVPAVAQRDSNVSEKLLDLKREHAILEDSVAALRRELEHKVDLTCQEFAENRNQVENRLELMLSKFVHLKDEMKALMDALQSWRDSVTASASSSGGL